MRSHSFRPRLEPLDDRCLPSLTLSGAYSVGDGPQDIVTADFNNDGRLDLATANTNGNSVSVLLGAGDGTFGDALQIASDGPDSLKTGDFNGDGNADLATLLYMEVPYWFYGRVDVFFGNGDGSFQPAQTVDEYSSYAIQVDDFNADGRSDLVIERWYPDPYHDPWGGFPFVYFAVLLGNSDGSFTETFSDLTAFPSSPAPDLNNDGYGDEITFVGYPWGQSVSVHIGRPDGTFAPALHYETGQYTSTVAVGDFNGDGRPDVAAASEFSDVVSVLLNDGNWPPADAPTIQINDAVVTEGHTGTRTATFVVNLSSAFGEPVTVGYVTDDGTAGGGDYQAATGTLTFAPGETEKTLTVFVNGDRVVEAQESYFVNLSGATNAYILDSQGVGTILDDEPRVSISDVSKKEGDGRKTTRFVFTVTLSAAYDQPVTMSFRTMNATATTSDRDYLAKSGSLTFNPGETTKTITIKVKDDSKREADETFYLDLFGLSSNAQFTKNRGVGMIWNDD
jgi:Calx-beta domain-containing protein/VCBS repeat protein